jgi:DNA polymerase-3 subunit epsilon
MILLFFDTETTGKLAHGMPHHHRNQPLPCQIGASMVDSQDGHELSAMNVLVDCTPWTLIETGAISVHGISNEQVKRAGAALDNVGYLFGDMVAAADRIVAHNMQFDAKVIRKMFHTLANDETGNIGDWGGPLDPFEDKDLYCTMMKTVPILQIPKPFKRTKSDPWKFTSLQECMTYFFNESIQGAHDALVDVRACARIYWELEKMELT